VQHCYNVGGRLTSRYLHDRLGSQLNYPHYSHSVGSGLLWHPLCSTFSTSSVALAKSKKHSVVRTKVEEELEAFVEPRAKLRMIGSSTKAPSSSISELDELWEKHNTLTAMYDQKVAAENSIRWLMVDELKGVPGSVMTKWIKRPKGSRKARIGLQRKHGVIEEVTSFAKNQRIRKELTEWDEDACKDLAPMFKEMVKMRASLAEMSGCKNFFELQSPDKMMNPKSVGAFLNKLEREMTPRMPWARVPTPLGRCFLLFAFEKQGSGGCWK